jgi:zinc transport system ATP-binding protein
MRGEEIVRLKGVCVSYRGVPALEEVDLSVRQRDFLGIIGPNGGGKTTLLRVILGLVAPRRGEVSVFGGRPRDGGKFVGYVPQYIPFDRAFPINVWDVVLMGRLTRAPRCGYFSAEDRARTRRALEAVEMLDLKERPIGALSEGQKQRVFIARALVTDPKLLLLDEPTASIDACMQEGIYHLLERLRQSMAIVLVTHDVGVLSAHVDTIACLNRRLHYHESKEITLDDLQTVYGCPVQLIAHGVPHRVMEEHGDR